MSMKRFLAFVLAFAMIFSLGAPSYAFADTIVAIVNDEPYYSLQDALDVGGTVQLYADNIEEANLTVNKDVELKGPGKSILSTITVNAGTLTINDNILMNAEAAPSDSIIVTGGTLSISNGQYNTVKAIGTNVTGDVTGGSFDKIAKILWADGYVYDNNSRTVVLTDAEAMIGTGADREYKSFAELAESGETVKLLKNVADAYTLADNASVAVDKNGKTLTVKANDHFAIVETEADGVTTYESVPAAAWVDGKYYATFAEAAAASIAAGKAVYVQQTLAEDDVYTLAGEASIWINVDSIDVVDVNLVAEAGYRLVAGEPTSSGNVKVTATKLYTITYNAAGGTVLDAEGNEVETFSIIDIAGADIYRPEEMPEREGYTFASWYNTADEQVVRSDLPATMPEGDETYTAHWTVNEYTVTFANRTGSTEFLSVDVPFGEAIPADEIADAEEIAAGKAAIGWHFAGWQQEIPASMPAEDVTLNATYEKTVYTLTVDPNGGDLGEGVSYPETYTVTDGLTLTDPTREGYTFKGWKLVKDDVEQEGYADTGFEPADKEIGNRVYTADWEANAIAITFKKMNGDVLRYLTQPADSEITDETKALIATEVPDELGYTFTGFEPEIPDTMPTKDSVIQLTYEKNTYTLEVNANGGDLGEGVSYPETYTVTDAIALTDPTREGYTFKGWNLVKDGENLGSVAPGAGISNMTGNRVYTAIWEANDIRITFLEKDGVTEFDYLVQPADSEISEETKEAYEAAAPAVSGYHFVEFVPAIPDTMPTTALSITAVYEPDVYTVIFDSDGGSEVESQEVYFGDTVPEPEDPTKEGHSFAGWVVVTVDEPPVATDEPAGITETPWDFDTPIGEDQINDEKTLTLTATWTTDDFKLIIDPAGGTIDGVELNEDGVYVLEIPYGSIDFPMLPDPEKAGNTFIGWDKEMPESMPAEDVTITAQWRIHNNGIMVNDPLTEIEDLETYYEENPIIGGEYDTDVTYPALSHPGVKLIGFFVGTNGSFTGDGGWVVAPPAVTDEPAGEDIADQFVVMDQDLRLFVIKSSVVPTNVERLTKYAFIMAPTTMPEGLDLSDIRDFDLDNIPRIILTNEDLTEAEMRSLIQTLIEPYDTITQVTALWQAESHTLSFVTSDGEDPYVITADYLENIFEQLPDDPERDGATFLYWLGSDGNKYLAPNDEELPEGFLPLPETMPAEDLTLTAEWKVETYTLTVLITDGKDSTTVVDTITEELAYGDPIVLPEDPEQDGYTFKQWYRSGGGAIPETMPAEPVTIKALWDRDEYTITYNTDGGEPVNPLPTNYNIEDTFTVPDLTKEGYTFAGWTGTDLEEPTTPLIISGAFGNREYTANWTVNSYTITFSVPEDVAPIDDMTVDFGDTPELPTPERVGYTFAGWYWGESPIPEGWTMPASNVDLTAEWTANEYTFTFNFEGATIVFNGPDQIADPLENRYTFTKPFGTELAEYLSFVGPYKEGYKFLYWEGSDGVKYLTERPWHYEGIDGRLIEVFDEIPEGYKVLRAAGDMEAAFETMPAEDITFTAVFEVKKILVFYVDNYEDEETEIPNYEIYDFGAEINYPTPEEIPGFEFIGYVDEDGWDVIEDGYYYDENHNEVSTWANYDQYWYNCSYPIAAMYYTLTDTMIQHMRLDHVFAKATAPDNGNGMIAPIWTPSDTYLEHMLLEHPEFADFIGTDSVYYVYALYRAEKHSITLDANGGTIYGQPAATQTGSTGEVIGTPVNPEWEGHLFAYWEDEDGNTYTSAQLPSSIGAEDLTFTAVWDEAKVVVVFAPFVEDFNETTLDFGENTSYFVGTYGSEIPYPENPTKEGYDFLGWADDQTMDGYDWDEALQFYNYDLNPDPDMRLVFSSELKDTDFAHFAVDHPMAKTSVPQGNFTWFKFVDGAWYQHVVIENPEFEEYADCDAVYVVYGLWRAQEGVVTYDPNGGKLNANWTLPEDGDFTATEAVIENGIATITTDTNLLIAVPAGNPTFTGYTFAGWADENGELVETLPERMPAGGMTLTAQWTAKEYTLTFVDDDEDATELDHITAPFGSEITAPEDPTRTGWTFKGWGTMVKDKETGELVWTATDIPETMPAKNMTFIASWEINDYDMIFDPDGGTFTVGNTEYADKNYTITAAYDSTISANKLPGDPTKAGHDFLYWLGSDGEMYAKTANAEAGIKAFPTKMPVDGMTFTAQWQVRKIAVLIYDTEEDVTVLTADFGETIEYPVPEREGYDFLGYIGADILEENLDRDFWNGNKLSDFLYDKAEYGALVTSSAFTDKMLAHMLLRINPLAPATFPEELYENEITADDIIENPELAEYADCDGIYVVHALWRAHVNTVTYDANGGKVKNADGASVTDFELSGDVGQAIFTPANPTFTGYTFAGWFDENDVQYGTAENPLPDVVPETSLVLTAKWVAKTITLTFKLNVDDEEPWATITDAFGSEITPPDEPTKEGYSFKGWDPELPETMPAKNMIFTAVFEINQYTLTFEFEGATMLVGSDAGDGNVEPEEKSNTYVFKADFESPVDYTEAPYMEGYNFLYWEGSDGVKYLPRGFFEHHVEYDDDDEWFTWVENDEELPEGYEWLPVTVPAEDLTFTAVFQIRTVAIVAEDTWEYSDPILYTVWKEEFGAAITYPTPDPIEGYEFLGYVDEEGWDRMYNDDGTWTNYSTYINDDDNMLVMSSELTDKLIQHMHTDDLFAMTTVPAGWDVSFPDGQELEHLLIEYPEMEQYLGCDGYYAVYAMWRAESHTLTLDANGGTVYGQPVATWTADTGTVATVPYATPERSGYTFLYWTDSEGNKYLANPTSDQLDEGFLPMPTVMLGHDETFTAQWDAETYAVIVFDPIWMRDADGPEDVIDKVQIIPYTVGETIEYPTMTREGFDFVAYYVDIEPQSISEPDMAAIEDCFVVPPYILHSNVNALTIKNLLNRFYTVAPETLDGEYARSVPSMTSSIVVPDEYLAMYQFMEELKQYDGIIQVYPVWQAQPFTVTYDANGGEMADVTAVVAIGDPLPMVETVEIPADAYDDIPVAEDPVLEGRTFLYWTDADGNKYLAPDDEELPEGFLPLPEYMPVGGLALTAEWEANPHTVKFYSPTWEAESLVDTFEGVFGDPIVVPEVTREGYTQTGWMNTDGGIVEIPETLPDEDLAFLAIWEVNKHNVTFDLGGGKMISSGNTEIVHEASYGDAFSMWAPAAEEFERAGYTFAGWDKDLSETMPDEDVTITAQWTANINKIYFAAIDPDTGAHASFLTLEVATDAEITEEMIAQAVEAAGTVAPLGYEFDKWAQEIPATMPATDIEINPEWKLITYTITYELNGGNAPEGVTYPESFDVTTAPGLIADPVKDGYTFLGWNVEFNGEVISTAAKNLNIGENDAGNFVLTAQWEANTNYIWFALKGEDSSFYTIEAKTDEEITDEQINTALEKAAELAPAGYEFDKWSVDIPATMPTSSMTIYPEWKLTTYTLEWNLDGGVAGGEYPTEYTIDSAAAAIADPTRDGFIFDGWTLAIDGVDCGNVGKDYTLAKGATGNRVYTATWSGLPMQLVFADGTEILDIVDTYVGEKVPGPAVNRTKDGYMLDPENLWVDYDGTVPYRATGKLIVQLNWIKVWSVYFMDGGKVIAHEDKARDGQPLSDFAPTLTKEGFELTGWMEGDTVYALDAPVYSDLTLTPVWGEAQPVEDYSTYARCTFSLNLVDNILMNFYVKDLKEGTNPADFTVEVADSGKRIPLTEMENNGLVIGSFAAKQMTDQVHVIVRYQDNVVKDDYYSIQRYCYTAIEKSTNDKLVTLAKAALDYGTYAQLYFNYKTDDLANRGTYFNVPGLEIPANSSEKSGACTGIVKGAASLDTSAQLGLIIKLTHDKDAVFGDYTFKLDGEETTLVIDDSGKYNIIVSNIPIMDMAEKHTVEVTNNVTGETFTYTTSPLCYLYAARNSASMGNLANALYNYYAAALAYLGR